MFTVAAVLTVETNTPLLLVGGIVAVAALVFILALEFDDRRPLRQRRELQWIALGVTLIGGGLAYGATTGLRISTIRHDSEMVAREPMSL
jgi:hypothetical protein